MNNNILEFTSRQVMNSPDFEFFHYSDNRSLNVEYHNHDFYEIFFSYLEELNILLKEKHIILDLMIFF